MGIMTKQLLIMRHAKSSWDDSRLSDFQRPLNVRGLRTAPRMAEFLLHQHSLPTYIASSHAVRARQTAELFLENCPADSNIKLEIVEEFYLAPARIYLNYLSNLSDSETGCVMLVGHNPGLEELFRRLAGHAEHFPTGAIAKFVFDIECWNQISPDQCKLIALWRPKEVLD
jgi:phosphohistidine phosphatase